MKAKVVALELNKTWVVVDLPPNVKPTGCKQVYKIKRQPDGSMEWYKARLVAKSYTLTEGVDYFETFSPVVKLTTIRVVLALASIKWWHVQQLDVDNAFLQSDLNKDIYMMVPLGLSTSCLNQCCKLLKSLYGLKQASHKSGSRSSLFCFCLVGISKLKLITIYLSNMLTMNSLL